MLWKRPPAEENTGYHPLGPLRVDDEARRFFWVLGLMAGMITLFLPLLPLTWWFITPRWKQASSLGMEHSSEVIFGLRVRAGMALLGVMILLPTSWGFWRLRDCFEAFAAGRPFSPRGLRGLRDFAIGISLGALARLFSPLIGSLVLTSLEVTNPVALSLEMSPGFVMLICFAAIIACACCALENAALLLLRRKIRRSSGDVG